MEAGLFGQKYFHPEEKILQFLNNLKLNTNANVKTENINKYTSFKEILVFVFVRLYTEVT